MIVKPTKPAHYGKINNRLTFSQAFEEVSQNPNRIYKTTGNKTAFLAGAKVTGKGRHKRERVIVFLTAGKEKARSYPCCWGHITNCNRTYIDCYTRAM